MVAYTRIHTHTLTSAQERSTNPHVYIQYTYSGNLQNSSNIYIQILYLMAFSRSRSLFIASVCWNDVASLFLSSDSVDYSICRRTVKCTRMSIHVYDIERLCYTDTYWLSIFVLLAIFWLEPSLIHHHLLLLHLPWHIRNHTTSVVKACLFSVIACFHSVFLDFVRSEFFFSGPA